MSSRDCCLSEPDVVVVGAGPVGLTTALLLAAAGVRVLLAERHDGTSDDPKAISLDDESLRTLGTAGALDAVLPIVTPGTGTRYYDAGGQPLFHARGGTPYRLGHPFKNPFAQPELEAALASAAADSPMIDVRFSTSFTSVFQDGDSVHVTLEDLLTGRVGSIRARYLLACDGGRSSVRQALGIGMSGRSHAQDWLVVDTLNDAHDQMYGMHHGDPDRPHVIIPGGRGRCRYELLLHDGEAQAGGAVPLDLIQRLLAPIRTIVEADVERAVVYRFHSLVADSWSRDRAFLLGDAAHMMPPFAGQGLNSGLRDAANLAWKIANVLDGRLVPTALATYEAERRPHATASMRLSERLGRVVMTTDRRVALSRDRIIRAAMSTPEGRTYLQEMHYRPVPDLARGLCAPDHADLGPAAAGRVLGQPRVFDATRRRVTMLDTVLGRGWALLGVAVDPAAWQAVPPAVRALAPVEIDVGLDHRLPAAAAGRNAVADVDGALTRETEPLRGRFVLVRPDRFVAATWLPHDAGRVLAALTAHQPRPTTTATR